MVVAACVIAVLQGVPKAVAAVEQEQVKRLSQATVVAAEKKSSLSRWAIAVAVTS